MDGRNKSGEYGRLARPDWCDWCDLIDVIDLTWLMCWEHGYTQGKTLFFQSLTMPASFLSWHDHRWLFSMVVQLYRLRSINTSTWYNVIAGYVINLLCQTTTCSGLSYARWPNEECLERSYIHTTLLGYVLFDQLHAVCSDSFCGSCCSGFELLINKAQPVK